MSNSPFSQFSLCNRWAECSSLFSTFNCWDISFKIWCCQWNFDSRQWPAVGKFNQLNNLIHRGQVTYLCVIISGHYWSGTWLLACLALSHCQLINSLKPTKHITVTFQEFQEYKAILTKTWVWMWLLQNIIHFCQSVQHYDQIIHDLVANQMNHCLLMPSIWKRILTNRITWLT